MAGALLRAAIVASPLRDGLPPVDLRAVCLVRAMVMFYRELTRARKWKQVDGDGFGRIVVGVVFSTATCHLFSFICCLV